MNALNERMIATVLGTVISGVAAGLGYWFGKKNHHVDTPATTETPTATPTPEKTASPAAK